jgi:hypothetical protein
MNQCRPSIDNNPYSKVRELPPTCSKPNQGSKRGVIHSRPRSCKPLASFVPTPDTAPPFLRPKRRHKSNIPMGYWTPELQFPCVDPNSKNHSEFVGMKTVDISQNLQSSQRESFAENLSPPWSHKKSQNRAVQKISEVQRNVPHSFQNFDDRDFIQKKNCFISDIKEKTMSNKLLWSYEKPRPDKPMFYKKKRRGSKGKNPEKIYFQKKSKNNFQPEVFNGNLLRQKSPLTVKFDQSTISRSVRAQASRKSTRPDSMPPPNHDISISQSWDIDKVQEQSMITYQDVISHQRTNVIEKTTSPNKPVLKEHKFFLKKRTKTELLKPPKEAMNRSSPYMTPSPNKSPEQFTGLKSKPRRKISRKLQTIGQEEQLAVKRMRSFSPWYLQTLKLSIEKENGPLKKPEPTMLGNLWVSTKDSTTQNTFGVSTRATALPISPRKYSDMSPRTKLDCKVNFSTDNITVKADENSLKYRKFHTIGIPDA